MAANDGKLDYGPRMPYPVGMDVFPDHVPLNSVQAVDGPVLKLAERTLLTKVLPALAGKVVRIGSAV